MRCASRSRSRCSGSLNRRWDSVNFPCAASIACAANGASLPWPGTSGGSSPSSRPDTAEAPRPSGREGPGNADIRPFNRFLRPIQRQASPQPAKIILGNQPRPQSDRSHGEVDSDQRSGRVRLRTLTLETTMPAVSDRHDAPTAIQSNLAAIFISLELSRSIWLVTSLSPGSAEKMSKHSVRAGDVAALLARFSELKRKASERTGKSFPIVVIHEAGLDGFWLHRVLQSEGIESHVVDPASIATSRRRRRAKTDRIDGEALLRALLAFKRGEPRVCAMVKAPTPEEEDRRRPLVGGAIPPIRQSPPTRVICGAGADALAKRIGRSRAGRLQSR